MNLFKVIYNSFVIGLSLSVLAFQNEWLEMRVNIGLIVPVTIIVSLIVYAFVSTKKTNTQVFRKLNITNTFINLIVLITLSVIFLGRVESMTLIPAMLREAMGISNVSLQTINISTIVFLIAGFTLIYRYESRKTFIRRKGARRIEKFKKINHS